MVRVEHVMGTVVSLHLRDPGIADAAVDGVFGWFHEVDARFSTYREDSEVSRLGRGALGVGERSDDVREVLALCDDVHRESEGIFEVWGRRHGPPFDPSALVKGWSVDRAAAMLEGAGARNFYLNAGGDVVARGGPQPGRGWRVGIVHPEELDTVAAVITAADCAVATSGAYERGHHIVDPRSGRPPSGLLSMTVVGPSLAHADAYATAAYVMGREGVGWVSGRPGYEAYAITAQHRAVFTAGFAQLLTSVTLDTVPGPSA